MDKPTSSPEGIRGLIVQLQPLIVGASEYARGLTEGVAAGVASRPRRAASAPPRCCPRACRRSGLASKRLQRSSAFPRTSTLTSCDAGSCRSLAWWTGDACMTGNWRTPPSSGCRSKAKITTHH